MVTLEKTFRYADIARQIQATIAERHMPGDLLEPEVVLAKKFSVNHRTVRQALDVLVSQGWISRHRGRGTVVADRLATGEFAVVVKPSLLGPDASPYYQKGVAAVMKHLHAIHPRYQVRLHLGRGGEDGDEFASSLDLLEPSVLSRLRGVFTFHLLPEIEQKLIEANVPVVNLGSIYSTQGYSVAFDDGESFLAQAVKALSDSGCRRVAFLSSHHADMPRPQAFLRIAATAGLQADRNGLPQVQGKANERNACECFMNFWEQSDRPDGVVVSDDMLCRGVLRAILKLGIEMPRQLQLITMVNRGVDLPCDIPVTCVEYDGVEQGQKAVEMMLALAHGKKPKQQRVMLSGKLVQGQTTNH